MVSTTTRNVLIGGGVLGGILLLNSNASAEPVSFGGGGGGGFFGDDGNFTDVSKKASNSTEPSGEGFDLAGIVESFTAPIDAPATQSTSSTSGGSSKKSSRSFAPLSTNDGTRFVNDSGSVVGGYSNSRAMSFIGPEPPKQSASQFLGSIGVSTKKSSSSRNYTPANGGAPSSSSASKSSSSSSTKKSSNTYTVRDSKSGKTIRTGVFG